MSTYVLMRILESAPSRYDRGIRFLTLGRLDKAYARLVGHIERGQQVLDLGCGTGALTLRAAGRGATVKGIDVNARMLELAVQRAEKSGLATNIHLMEMGVAELDGEPSQYYEAVMSGLCLSELSEDELTFTLKEVLRILRPGGLLLIADELKPQGCVKRLMHALIRTPLAVLTYIFTQQTTHPASKLSEKLRAANFSVLSAHLNWLGSFGEFVAQKQVEPSS